MYSPYNQSIKHFAILACVGLFLLYGCSSSQMAQLDGRWKDTSLKNSFHGLVVQDAKTTKVLYQHNGDKYFTPASNTKIATILSGIELLPNRVPTLKYLSKNDSIYIEGTGDPTWLHPYFKDSTALNFLKKYSTILWYPNNSAEDKFGPGWAWEDYDAYFSPEKSTLPIYGNVVTVLNANGLQVSPQLFANDVTIIKKPFLREASKNQFYVPPLEQDTLEVPFITSSALTQQLLENVLEKEVIIQNQSPDMEKSVLYGLPTDSIYKRILFKSDNFLAEQVLMMASSTLSDTLSTQTTISHMLEHTLADLQDKPRWVDGSGLSRYNLFTPKSLVQILQKLHDRLSQERLLQLFPMWTSSGTVQQWDHPYSTPFIFAKSGSLGNNYNLSGYLKTKSGKLLVFSFMNNHFRIPPSLVRTEMFATLKALHDKH